MAYRESYHCDEETCAATVSAEEMQPGSSVTPWISVNIPTKDVRVRHPLTGQVETLRDYQTLHFDRAHCLALWACGLADGLRERDRQAEEARRAEVGAGEFLSPIPAMQAMRRARQQALRTDEEQAQYDRLAVWLYGQQRADMEP